MAKSNVIEHPSRTKVPAPMFPLTTKDARVQYDSMARTLFDRGKLTKSTHTQLSMYAAAMDEIFILKQEKKPVRAAMFTRVQKLLRSLGIDDDDTPVAKPREEKANPFALFGAPARRRQALQEGPV